MHSGAGEIVLQTRQHPNPLGQWITFTIILEGSAGIDTVVDSGAPMSAISPETADFLRRLGLLAPPVDPRYHFRLTSAIADGQPLPDFDVRVLRRLATLEIRALVGLDFLQQFTWIRFHVPTRRLFLASS